MNSSTSVPRLDGPAKVTGAARYTADHNEPDQLHGVLVGAPVPAGHVLDIGSADALRQPGVRHVLSAADMPTAHADLAAASSPPLASLFLPMQGPEIHYSGQPVAIVLAETLEAAEGAASLVQVRCRTDEFTVPDSAPATTPSPESGYNAIGMVRFRKGDAEAAVAASPVQAGGEYLQPARHANPMEPSAVLAVWNDDRLTVHDAAQHVYAVRSNLAAAFGIDPGKVRVHCRHTGGGFGAKAYVWQHEILAAMAAKVVGRPVKLVLTRSEMYTIVGYQARMRQNVRLGAAEDGRLTGVVHEVDNTTAVTDDYIEFGSAPSGSLYATPAILLDQKVRRGNVNLPTFMRSPIDGPGTWALGSAMDELARALDMDPLDLRLINHADADPSDGRPWSSKKLKEAYAEGARRFGWRKRGRGGTRDGDWLLGWGMADSTQGQFRFPSEARVRLAADATARLEAGYTDIGAGSATIFPQIAASVLGLPPTAVRAASGDSDLPFAGPTFGSGTTIGMGAAVQDAAQKIIKQLAHLAGWPAEEVHAQDGHLIHGTRSRSLTDVMRDARVDELIGDGAFSLPGGAPADAGDAERATRTFGAVFVEVGVDPDLGLLRLRRATGVYSVGRVINPRTARSQMIGGVVWGWGMAAMEASLYEPNLGRWLSTDLAGVPLPVNADIPPAIDIAFIDEFDEYAGPLGAKGIGELGATGVAAAVANAVYDAIGKRVRDLPITPEKLIDLTM
ncbi:xanthine dehydrogenase YagR molybdenum-binding subunit [Streptomyces sp. CEV 2-1]|uniref:xanthine dehydrogenase family protein molybdopterin-binding subunit n=1 Tax=unclassified Streptomyces TaxID=2593676 RepID=UPI000F470C76|nr:xanthine dehydrogenase family protein molybdopterin-binding subunit [Streptomyces sp. CEV 2-1]ROQ77605.1 xanthine dehydrogenase YagR molybdenum-binding subunit [Streptomyces sp. CEV 2-1]